MVNTILYKSALISTTFAVREVYKVIIINDMDLQQSHVGVFSAYASTNNFTLRMLSL